MGQSVWGPVQGEMSELLASHPDDVPTVVAQLTTLGDLLARVPATPRPDPLGDFNLLYLTVTEGVLEGLYAGSFRDPAFVSRLDVEVATRYFDALRAWAGPEASPACPRAWAGLFRWIDGPDVGTLPSVGAGVSAHLAFDLPFALVTTLDQLGSDPVDDSDQHLDYLTLHEMFAARLPDLDCWWPPAEPTIGGPGGRWPAGTAADGRNCAWRAAQRLWGMRHDLGATARERAHLDRMSADLGGLPRTRQGALSA